VVLPHSGRPRARIRLPRRSAAMAAAQPAAGGRGLRPGPRTLDCAGRIRSRPGRGSPASALRFEREQIAHNGFGPSWIAQGSGSMGAILTSPYSSQQIVGPSQAEFCPTFLRPVISFRRSSSSGTSAVLAAGLLALKRLRQPRRACAQWRCPPSRWRWAAQQTTSTRSAPLKRRGVQLAAQAPGRIEARCLVPSG